jgi:hypothetical protein
MSQDLPSLIGDELNAPVRPPVRAMAVELARRFETAGAVLFYGSILRTGDFDGVMDFYVLTQAPRRGLRGAVGRVLWPDVSYYELEFEGRTLRAKVASMTLAQFAAAVGGRGLDTTIWTRFVQPCALVWTASPQIGQAVSKAVAQACVTASRFAAVVGPAKGSSLAYWQALFRQTYAAEFRVEARGRENKILEADPGRYEAILPAAWRAGGLAFETLRGGELAPQIDATEGARLLAAWRLRRTLGKSLNLARLAKAAFTFEGAANYAAWKIERHTGLNVPLTPWRERHVILASPGVFWRLWQARRKASPRPR